MSTLLFILAAWLFGVAILGLVKPKLVVRWGAQESRTRGKAFGLYTMLGCVFFGLFIFLAPDPQSATPVLDPTPQRQKDFVATVNGFIEDYKAAPNAIQKTDLRTERGQAIARMLDQQLVAQQWTGIIKSITTQTDGDAFLVVTPLGAEHWTVQTWDNGLSDLPDSTIIRSGSAVHDALRSINEGDQIIFQDVFSDTTGSASRRSA